MVDFSKLPEGTIEWLNTKINFNVDEYTNDTEPITVLQLFKSFCNTAKIWN